MNPNEDQGDPTHYAIIGTTLKVTPIYEDSFNAVFESKLTALSASNTTNWLLTLAPDAYLTMCLAEESLFTRDFAAAGGLEAKAISMVDEIVAMDQVAAYGNVEMQPDTVMP